MRDIRPSNGGPGFSEEMVTYVRALNYDLDPEEEEESVS